MRSLAILALSLAASTAASCSHNDLNFEEPSVVITVRPPLGGILDSTSGLARPVHLALAGQTILFATPTEVMTIPLGGGMPALKLHSEGVIGLVTDGRFAFWADRSGVIQVLDLPSDVVSVFSMGRGAAGGLAIDATNVYWTANKSLYAMPRIASALGARGLPTELAARFDRVGRVVAAGGSVVFVGYDAESPNGRLIRLPTSGDLPNTVAQGAYALGSLATDGIWAFWTVFRFDNSTSTPQGGVFRAAVRGGDVESLSGLLVVPGEIAVVGQHLYIHDGVLHRITTSGMFDNWMPFGPVDCYAVNERTLVWVTSNTDGWALMVRDLSPLP